MLHQCWGGDKNSRKRSQRHPSALSVALCFFLAVTVVASSNLAIAQNQSSNATIARNVTAESGKPVRILVVINVHADCTSGPLPAVKLLQGPAHGDVVVRRGKATLTNTGTCLATQVPAYVVFYKSRPSYTGKDELELEVNNSETHITHIHKISVTVAGGGQQL